MRRLLHLPEPADIGQAVNDAMRAIEEDNDDLRDTLPKDYRRIQNSTLVSLLRAFEDIPTDIEGDAIGRIYNPAISGFAHWHRLLVLAASRVPLMSYFNGNNAQESSRLIDYETGTSRAWGA